MVTATPSRAGEPAILPMGDDGFLLEVGGLDEVLALHRTLEASVPDGVVDLVPAARTVCVRVDPARLTLAAARAWAREATADAASVAPSHAEVVELDVAYEGVDLAETAALLGIGPGELVERHTGAEWTVAFTGFAPGFGYLVSAGWPFDVPRLDSPRTRVPAGSVGLAAGFTGAYPRETPGGWRLIGTTGATLFDASAASPALLAPGTRVRFRSVATAAGPPPAPGGSPVTYGRSAPHIVTGEPPTGLEPEGSPVTSGGSGRAIVTGEQMRDAEGAPLPGIEVIEPGLLATLQDLGRPGVASVGVARSGALDRGSLRTANRLVGNPEDAAGVEVTMGGFRAVATDDVWFAVTGAWGPIRLRGADGATREVDPYEAHPWHAGEELQLDWFGHGARGYLAVRGGLDARPVLGSRSTDTLAGLGPPRLRAGDRIAVRDDADAPIPVVELAPWSAPDDDELELELAPGPRQAWFAASARAALFEEVWTVTNDSDRVGMRLDGPELKRVRGGELPSEGMVPGALQVPPEGRPTILLADGPVTGGYPVIAVVTDAALDLLAQARPGTRLRFRHARPAL